jgi:hypothetical protein
LPTRAQSRLTLLSAYLHTQKIAKTTCVHGRWIHHPSWCISFFAHHH